MPGNGCTRTHKNPGNFFAPWKNIYCKPASGRSARFSTRIRLSPRAAALPRPGGWLRCCAAWSRSGINSIFILHSFGLRTITINTYNQLTEVGMNKTNSTIQRKGRTEQNSQGNYQQQQPWSKEKDQGGDCGCAGDKSSTSSSMKTKR